MSSKSGRPGVFGATKNPSLYIGFRILKIELPHTLRAATYGQPAWTR